MCDEIVIALAGEAGTWKLLYFPTQAPSSELSWKFEILATVAEGPEARSLFVAGPTPVIKRGGLQFESTFVPPRVLTETGARIAHKASIDGTFGVSPGTIDGIGLIVGATGPWTLAGTLSVENLGAASSFFSSEGRGVSVQRYPILASATSEPGTFYASALLDEGWTHLELPRAPTPLASSAATYDLRLPGGQHWEGIGVEAIVGPPEFPMGTNSLPISVGVEKAPGGSAVMKITGFSTHLATEELTIAHLSLGPTDYPPGFSGAPYLRLI